MASSGAWDNVIIQGPPGAPKIFALWSGTLLTQADHDLLVANPLRVLDDF